ncbi:Tetracycline resistance protein, class C [Halioglobus japonicus]|nr:Tetracycline resistance protein, class C [Halioglobus japonicus]
MPILFGVIVLDLIGFGIVIPILPFLSPTLGADKMDIALILVTYAVCAGFCGPVWGRLSDRIGRKPVLMICLAGAACSYVMLGLASELWMVYAARGFAGLMAGNFGVASAMIADMTTPKNRARGMGLIGAAFGLGIVLGPVLGGLLSGPSASFTLPCMVAGIMSVLAIAAAAVFLPESLPAQKRQSNKSRATQTQALSNYALLRSTGTRMLVSQYVLHQVAVSAVTYLVPLWMGDLLGWTAREVGIVFGIQGILMVIVQGGLLSPMVQWLGEWRLLCWSISALLLGLLSAAFASSMLGMVCSVYMAMTGATICIPLLNTIVSRTTALEVRGRMMGITSAASSWGRVVGPLLTGVTLATAGYRGAWLSSAGVVSIYLAWACVQYARQKPGGIDYDVHGDV